MVKIWQKLVNVLPPYLSIYFFLLIPIRNGRLHRNSNTDQLPTREQLNIRPNPRTLRPETSSDFVAGDTRANEHPFLSSVHAIFLREHNRIAKLLKEYLPPHLQQVSKLSKYIYLHSTCY